jgi:hypothetical protein
MMPQAMQRSVSVVLLLGQLLTGTLLELAHTEQFVLPGSGHVTVASHECGSREVHKSRSESGVCLACAFSLQRSALETRTFDSPSIQLLGIPVTQQHTLPASLLHFYSSGKRGPPAA